MRNANQEPDRLREPNMAPFFASWRWYRGKFGLERHHQFEDIEQK